MKNRELIDNLVDGQILTIKAKKTGNILYTRPSVETPFFVDAFDGSQRFSLTAMFRWLRPKRHTIQINKGIAVVR